MVLDDPARDDHGPGDYVYPSNQEYRRGSFDLRSLTIERDGDDVVFEVRFGAELWEPPETRRTEAQRFVLENGIFVQHVDIYIDHTPGAGSTEALPGRNLVIDSKNPWDVAVVLTPRPFLLRSLISDWKPSERVVVPSNLRSFKNVVRARVSIAELGRAPDPSWGYVVAVFGALWENTFDAVDRLTGGPIVNALTMPVVTVAEPLAFGGGHLHNWQPFAIDIIVPPGRSQSQILSNYDREARRVVALPAVYPDEDARAAAERRARPADAPGKEPGATPGDGLSPSEDLVVAVQRIQGEIVVLEAAEVPPEPFAIGTIFGPTKERLARVVVTQVYPKFILATVIEGAEHVRPNVLVRFPRSP